MYQYVKKAAGPAKCGVTGARLNGVSGRRYAGYWAGKGRTNGAGSLVTGAHVGCRSNTGCRGECGAQDCQPWRLGMAVT